MGVMKTFKRLEVVTDFKRVVRDVTIPLSDWQVHSNYPDYRRLCESTARNAGWTEQSPLEVHARYTTNPNKTVTLTMEWDEYTLARA